MAIAFAADSGSVDPPEKAAHCARRTDRYEFDAVLKRKRLELLACREAELVADIAGDDDLESGRDSRECHKTQAVFMSSLSAAAATASLKAGAGARSHD